MRIRSRLSWLVVFGAVGACNAIFGLDELEEAPPGGGDSGQAGEGTGGSAGTGKGGSSGSGTSKGGSAGGAGIAGEGGGGMGGGGDCEPDHEATCGAVFPNLLGNCRDGQIVCQADGTWGECSVTPRTEDSCDTEGDDADCDGTANGGCPCLDGAMRDCGPDTDDGICEFGTQTCESGAWGDCEGAVLPEARDCLSATDNDCDGTVDNARDDQCPCAVDGAHVCVEDAPSGWEGPAALATGPGGSSPPLCAGTGYERQVASLFGSINEGTPQCSCGCTTPTGTCSGAVGIHSTTTPQACSLAGINITDPFEYTVNQGSCTGSLPSNVYFKPIGPSFNPTGTCTVQRTATIPTPSWGRRMVACETNSSSPAGCAAAAQCVPELVNPLEQFCIYKDGENACPAGPFSVQRIYYEAFTDGRSCSACGCGTATGTCQGFVDFASGSGSGCSRDLLVDRANYGSCVTWDGSFPPMVAVASVPTPMGMCPPSGGTLQGGVTKTGALTLCCKP